MEWKEIRQWPTGRWLTLILTFYFLLGLYYIWQVPPFEGPDEGEHFAYIEWLVDGNGFPPQGDAAWETPVRQEAGQPPLYYLLAAVPATITGITEPAVVYQINAYAFTGPAPHQLGDNDNRALHYPEDGRPLRGGWLAFYLSRGLTLFFGLLLLGSLYGLGRSFWPHRPEFSLAATALVAFTPQVVYLSSVVSNDIPAAALSTLCLWLLVGMVRYGPTRGRAVAAGAVLGLAALTKVSTLLLIVPLGLGLGWLWWSGRYRLPDVGRTGLWLGSSLLAVAGWWFGRTWLRYGTPLGLESHNYAPWAIQNTADLFPWLARWSDVFYSYWLALGWGTIRPPGWVYGLLGLLMLLAWLGLGRLFYRLFRQRPDHWVSEQRSLWLIFSAMLLLLILFLEIWMRRVMAPHGRLLFPAIAVTTFLLVRGWFAVHPRLPLLPIAGLGLLTLLSPPLLLQPAYQPPPLLTPAETEALSGLRWQFGEVAGEPLFTLLTAQADTPHVGAGEILPVTLCWRSEAATERDYVLLVHLLGPDNQIIARRSTHPGNGRFPTSAWSPDSAFCDQVRLAIPPHTPSLVYRIEVGMIDDDRLERLTITTRAGQILTLAIVDQVRVDAPVAPLSLDPAAGSLQLVDYDLPRRTWRTGESHDLHLTWGTAESLPADYQIFVHLRQSQTGAVVAQADGPPLDGWYPTSWWPPQTPINESRQFPLPADVPPGRYELLLGFYSLIDQQPVSPEFSLGEVRVTP
jgi:4-amino-4-deoxy-L-arabinose transferase-like glycosyltransferase